jgi:polysaccharide chain length determinant protein (PEP-CTERM system associated)
VLPGKKFTPDDVLRILWRRKWLIALPFAAVSLGTAVVASGLPERFRSDTLILIDRQRVPDAYVRSTVSSPNERETNIQERLAPVRQQVLSRSRLERIIVDLNLYPRERAAGTIEDIVERMRTRDIEIITPPRTGDSFQIAFTYEDRRRARDVVNELARQFIDASNQERTSFAEATTTFLGSQLEEAKSRLQEIEKQLTSYKLRHAGELPSERDANLQVLSSLQMQVQQLVESINRDSDQRFSRERQLAELTAEPVPVPPPIPVAPTSTAPGESTGVTGRSATEDLEAARRQLRLLQLRFTDNHWDVQRQRKVIQDLEAKVQQEALQKPLTPESPAPATPAETQRQNRIRDLRLEIESIDRTIATKQQEEKTLRDRIAEYRRRVEATPVRESELTTLNRDYTTLQERYHQLLAKQEDSKIAENLERRQQGERFRTVDQARLPERPISPNRPLIDLIGAIVGLGLGLGFAAFLEYRDNSFRCEDEIVRLLSLPVVAVVPVMLTSTERRLRRRRTWMLSVVGGVFVMSALTATAWFILKG